MTLDCQAIIFDLAAARLGVEPAACVVVEGAPAWIAAARAVGARVIAVASTNEPTMLSRADAILPELAALRVEADTDGLVVRVA